MKNDLFIKDTLYIPENELEITASRSSGPGGQHVNKTDSKITVRWNVINTSAFSPEVKERIVTAFASRLTQDGDFVIHQSTERSQLQNKRIALSRLADEIRKALFIPKKRRPTRISKGVKEARLQKKSRHGALKKLRSGKINPD